MIVSGNYCVIISAGMVKGMGFATSNVLRLDLFRLITASLTKEMLVISNALSRDASMLGGCCCQTGISNR